MKKLSRFATMSSLTGGALLLAACQNTPATTPQAAHSLSPNVGMANPASVFCAQQGGQTIIKKDAAGNEVGYCRLPNGQTVEEWDFFRKNAR